MKKIIFLFAIVLVASFAMAQNTAVTTQTGNENEAIVTQVGLLNDASVTQIGNLNEGMVDQDGAGNIAVVDQLDGDANEAVVQQEGNGNEAYLTQGMVEAYYDAPHDMSTAMEANLNTGFIDQNGDGNAVEIVQVGNGNTGSVTQDGSDNKAWVYQGWPFGFWGETVITSALASYNSTASISQVNGNANMGAIWQYGGTSNIASISQDGSDNVSQISQGFIYEDANYDFSHPVYNVSGNNAVVAQIGVGNSSSLFQLGDDNSFTLTQEGNGNTVGGRGLSGLEAARNGYFEQDGYSNLFVGIQTDGATLDHTSRQTGNYNEINMTQSEDDWAKIIQTGNLNDVMLLQYGGKQNATITQTGDSNTSSVTQGSGIQ